MFRFRLEKIIIGRHSTLIFTRLKHLCFMTFIAYKAMLRLCHCSAVKDYSLFRFCLQTFSQMIESLMTEQLIKLDLHYYEQCFFCFAENTTPKNVPVILPCLKRKASNLLVVFSQQSKHRLPW